MQSSTVHGLEHLRFVKRLQLVVIVAPARVSGRVARQTGQVVLAGREP